MPLLAYKFMEDSTRWWEIAEVNPQLWYPLDMSAGSYIKIPS
jgi:prophage DNA circulation protein